MAKQPREELLFTSGAAAKVIGITGQRVIELERLGRLEAMKTTTGWRLFRESTILAELERRRKLKKSK
jgi:hypothetical protein